MNGETRRPEVSKSEKGCECKKDREEWGGPKPRKRASASWLRAGARKKAQDRRPVHLGLLGRLSQLKHEAKESIKEIPARTPCGVKPFGGQVLDKRIGVPESGDTPVQRPEAKRQQRAQPVVICGKDVKCTETNRQAWGSRAF